MEPESLSNDFFDLLRDIVSGEVPVKELKGFMKKIKQYCDAEEIELEEFLEEVFPDVICEEVHEIINDSNWRSDEVGPNCLSDEQVLNDLYPILTDIDQNVEVVFATNPYISSDLLNKLSESTYFWEEDGTASALARNTTNEAILEKLAKSSDSSTRFSVAANPRTSVDVLKKLAQDMDFSQHMLFVNFDGGMSPGATDLAVEIMRCSIKYSVIHNPNTPKDVIETIASTENNFDSDSSEMPFGQEYEEQVNKALCLDAQKVIQTRL